MYMYVYIYESKYIYIYMYLKYINIYKCIRYKMYLIYDISKINI